MKNTFFEYNALDKDVLDKMWKDALFIFDTNVLLNLYRYSNETTQKILEIITKFKSRIWLPFQVGLEFNTNRLTVISEQKKHYLDLEKKVNDIVGEVENKNRNPFLSETLFQKLIAVKTEIKLELDNKIEEYDKRLVNDDLLIEINTLFENQVGSPFPEDYLKEIYKDGEQRYKAKVPPGYCDFKKPDYDKFGDLIIWKQIINKAKDLKTDVIFVLDDRKEDWWLEHHGKTISPRPELLKEFKTQTDKNCHFYKPFQFLEFSYHYLGNSIEEEVISEVKNYKLEIPVPNSNFIQINLTLRGSTTDLDSLISNLKNAGYNVYKESDDGDDLHEIFIVLPNIPDLERRLVTKYLTSLDTYNIFIVKSSRR